MFPPRIVSLVLCDSAGQLLGELPPFEEPVPWFAEVAPVVATAQKLYGINIVVLRVLSGEQATLADGTAIAGGGQVRYLAEVVGRQPDRELIDLTAEAQREASTEDPKRLSFAHPNGWAADVAWATGAAEAVGRSIIGPARQIRSWNLSSIWQLPTVAGPTWLKVVPPFFAHEGAMIERLRPSITPPLIATEPGRILLDHIDGPELRGADIDTLSGAVAVLVELQASWINRIPELVSLHVPDWRPDTFVELAHDVVERTAAELAPTVAEAMDRFVDHLPSRFDALAECGIPDTLVHGDYHPGNILLANGRYIILDWGDCGIGHPLLDLPAFLGQVPPQHRSHVRELWADAWAARVPGCDPRRAMDLIAPIAAVRQAIVYRGFLDNIEESEQMYHRDDPRLWLQQASALLTAE
jgi:hypothetical protein